MTVTHVDGVVYARSVFHHSMNYRSAVVHGRARLVTDDAERLRRAARRHRARRARLVGPRPPADPQGAGRHRRARPGPRRGERQGAHGPPVDDDEDVEAGGRWAGVVPVRTVFDAPQPCPLLPAPTPSIPPHTSPSRPADGTSAAGAAGELPSSHVTTAPAYPRAERLDLVDDLHGRAVADPYRWLEDPDDPRTRDWSAAQDALARGHLDALPGRDRFANSAARRWWRRAGSGRRCGGPGGRFATRREPGQEHGVLHVTEPGRCAARAARPRPRSTRPG